jgi:hypothetical protein
MVPAGSGCNLWCLSLDQDRSRFEKRSCYSQAPPSNYDIAASVELSAKQYGETNFDEALAKNIRDLRRLLDDLERRGGHVLFL